MGVGEKRGRGGGGLGCESRRSRGGERGAKKRGRLGRERKEGPEEERGQRAVFI